MADAPRNSESPDPDETGPTEPLAGGPERPDRSAEPRRLTRSSSDSVIGGVAGGLGRYFSIDPILFRIGFVLLSFTGGLGVFGYLAMLALVPRDGDERSERANTTRAVAGVVVLGLAVVIFLGPPLFFVGPGLLVLALVVVAGVLLWRTLGGEPGGDPARTAAQIAIACLIAVATVGAAVGVGVAAALGGGVVIAGFAIVAGLALIGTAFVGGARWLIVPAVALVLPLGIVAAAGIDFDGGIGDRTYRPATASELRDRYEVGIGSLDVDLRELDLPAGRTDLAIDVGLGDAVVYVPAGACVTSDVQVGAGAADVLNRDSDGIDVALLDRSTAPDGTPHLHVDGDVGIGAIEIVREGDRRDLLDHDGWGPRGDRSSDRPPQATGCAA